MILIFISGTMLGFFVGGLTLLLLQFSPLTMRELQEWQIQAQQDRDEYVFR